MTGTTDPAPTRSLACRAVQILLLCMLLPTGAACATAGFAEYSWYFHDQPGQWIEWHHGDVCPPEAPRKECALVRRSKEGTLRPDFGQFEALLYAGAPQSLYVNTVLALLPLAVGWLGLERLWGRWRQRATDPSRWKAPSTWVLGLITVLACWRVPYALLVLFPASPTADGWRIVIGLFFNVLIPLATFTLWLTYRRLFPPPGRSRPRRWARLFLWPIMLLSSLLAPLLAALLIWGPPNLLMFLFPPMMLPNIVVSLLAVAAASAATNAIARRATISADRSDPPPRDAP